jgi:hypothetical protein
MWYRIAKLNKDFIADISAKMADKAVDFWKSNLKGTTPNLHIAFSTEMSKALIELTASEADWNKGDKEGIYDSLKSKLNSYAALFYREMGLRYTILLSDIRSGELSEDKMEQTIREEMTEGTEDLICQALGISSASSHREEEADPEDKIAMEYRIMGADHIDLGTEDAGIHGFHLKK